MKTPEQNSQKSLVSDIKFDNNNLAAPAPAFASETIQVGNLDTVHHDTILEQNKESDTSRAITASKDGR